MNLMRVSFISSTVAALVCIPSLSYSDVKGTLTNGREIIADTRKRRERSMKKRSG